MTASDLTLLVIIADRTGSMGVRADGKEGPTRAELTTQGIHSLVREQQAQPGRLQVSLIDFDTRQVREVEVLGDGSKTLEWECSPREMTPLYDAIGQTIAKTGEYLSAKPEHERPGKVIILIATDGYENSSVEYKAAQVRDMVKHQQDFYNWQFVYIGCELDAMKEGGAINIGAASTISTAGAYIPQTYATTSGSVSSYRSGYAQAVAYTPTEQATVAPSIFVSGGGGGGNSAAAPTGTFVVNVPPMVPSEKTDEKDEDDGAE